MWAAVGSRLRDRLAFVVEDFNVEKQLELDLVRGSCHLRGVHLSSQVREIITQQLCDFAPIAVDRVDFESLKVEISLSEGTRVHVAGVAVHLQTTPAQRWDAEQLRECFQAAKKRKLALHQKLMHLSRSEGEGFLHSVVATVLDSLDLRMENLQLQLCDGASLRFGEEPRHFAVGGSLAAAELLRGGGSGTGGALGGQEVVLRHVRLSRPSVWIDLPAGPSGAASPPNSGPASPTESPRSEAAVARGWILEPSEDMACELALLQCRRSVSAAGVGRGTQDGSNLVQAHDFVDLVRPMHASTRRASIEKEVAVPTVEGRGNWYSSFSSSSLGGAPSLPRSGAILGAASLTLQLTPARIEALIALAAYVQLGYRAVLRGAKGAGGAPAAAVVERYKTAWLGRAFLHGSSKPIPRSGVSDDDDDGGGGGDDDDDDVSNFERDAPLEVVIRAREDALAEVAKGSASPSSGSLSFLGRLLPRSLHACSYDGVPMSVGGSDWDKVAYLVRDALTMRDPGWRSSWQRLAQQAADGAVLLVGGRCRSVTVNIKEGEEEAALSPGGSSSPCDAERRTANSVSLRMEAVDFSACLYHHRMFAQACLTKFSVEDYFGPAQLQRLANGEPTGMPVSTVIVQPGHEEAGDGESSKLYAAIGRRFHRSSTEEPDGTLCLRTFGELHICVPPTQLLVASVSLFTPNFWFVISRSFAGMAWRRCAAADVLKLAEGGVEAARELWASDAEGYSDKWKLDIEVEPVRLFFPVPGTSVSNKWWGATGWAEVYVFNFGRMAGHSMLQPRQAGDPDLEVEGTFSNEDEVRSSQSYDKYSAEVSGITVERRERQYGTGHATEPLDAVSRVLMLPTTSEVNLFICHWTAVEMPQALVHYHASSMDIQLLAVDIHAMTSMLSEILGVATKLTKAAARNALSRTKRHLQELRNAAKLARQRRGPGYSNLVGKLGLKVFGHQPLQNTKLWDVVVVLDAVNVKLKSVNFESDDSQGSQDNNELELVVTKQKLKGFTCLDGSMKWTYSLAQVVVAGPAYGGVKLYRSPVVHADSASRTFKHVVLVWVLEAPDDIGGEWLLWVDVGVIHPVVVLWWPMLSGLVHAALQGIARVKSQRKQRGQGGGVSLEKVLSFSRTRQRPKCALDRIYVCARVQKAEVLVPTLWDRGRSCNKSRIVAFPGPSGHRPLFSWRGSTRCSVDVQWPEVTREGEDVQTMTNADLHLACVGVAADFVVPEEGSRDNEGTLCGVHAWTRGRGRDGRLSAVAPCRFHAALSLSEDTFVGLKVKTEPLVISVFPATLGLLLDLVTTAKIFAHEGVRSWRDLLVSSPSPEFTPDGNTQSPEPPKVSRRASHEDPHLDASAEIQVPSLIFAVSNMPGKVEPLQAEFALEDISLRAACHLTTRRSTTSWSSRVAGMARLDVLNALSLQVEPILEPVHWRCRVSSEERGKRKLGLPEGTLRVSWANLNLPVGLVYSAKLWFEAEEAVHKAAMEGSTRATLDRSSAEDAACATWSASGQVVQNSTTLAHPNEDSPDRVCGCQILNGLGEDVAVRPLDGASEDWRMVRPMRVDCPHAETNSNEQPNQLVACVPRLVLRGCVSGAVFEVTLWMPLQVGQFEVIRLKVPARRSQCVSLLLRAVPEQGGQGCALMIVTPVLLRNNTTHNLLWWTPKRSIENCNEHLMEDEDAVGRRDMSIVQADGRLSVEWNCPVPSNVEVTVDNPGVETHSRWRSRHLAAYRQEILPLGWMVAAGDPEVAPQLNIGVQGGNTRQMVLPADTLRSMGSFDFSKSHREEEERLPLGGSILKLEDTSGKPLHLCCTVNVGLLGDRACCLEIVVSSCVYVVNHLPSPIAVTFMYHEDEFQQVARMDSGGSCKTDLDADDLNFEIENDDGTICNADMPLRSNCFLDDVQLQTVLGPKLSRVSGLGARWQQKEVQRKSADKGLTIFVQNASALNVEPPVHQRGGIMDGFLEQLSFFHPAEWATYRRALIVYVRCWFENCSTHDVWLRPAGMFGVSATAELHVPPSQRRLLPTRLMQASKLCIGIEEKGPRLRMAAINWRKKRQAKVRHIKCSSALAPLPAHFGITVGPAPFPFSQSQVVRLYDGVTLLNLLDHSLLCWASAAFPLAVAASAAGKGSEVATAIVRPAREDNSVDGLERLDCRTHLTAVRFAALALCDGDAQSAHHPKGRISFSSHTGSSAHHPKGRISFSSHTMSNVSLPTRSGGEARRIVKQNSRQVSLENPCSFQVRHRYAETPDGSYLYENTSVTVTKLHQSAATLVTFEPGEPCFVIRNETGMTVIVRQRGVPGEGERLEPWDDLEFVWYDPQGILELAVQACSETSMADTVTGTRRVMSETDTPTMETFSSAATHSKQFSIARDFSPQIGYELWRIMTGMQYKTWELAHTGSGCRSGLVLDEARSGTDASLPGTKALQSGLHVLVDGVGVALSDGSPLQFLYAAADKLEIRVTVSETQREEGAHRPTLVASSSLSSLGSTSGRVFDSLMPFGLESSEVGHCGSPVAPCGGTSTSVKSHKTAGGTLALQSLLSMIPILDVNVSLLNLQADSHVPGSFFPCVLRAFRGRSQLWRSLECYSEDYLAPGPLIRRTLREPVLKVDIVGCHVIGTSLVVKSCKADLDKLVVNVDEALLVAVGAFYCRIAVYFKLPPFESVQEATAKEATGLRRSSLSHEESIRSRLHQDQCRVGELERQAGLEHRKLQSKGWLIRVEDTLDIGETTSYLSMRLIESSSPYVENLQRDAHMGVLLGMLTPFYGAAAFQPAMLSASSRALWEQRICMSPRILAKIFNEHFVEPIKQQFCWLLVVSLDFIGNPVHILRGVVAGLRELVRQPYRRGLVGFPLGVFFFLCSLGGSVFDMMARISNSMFKGIDRVQRVFYSRLGVKTSRQASSVFALSRAPTSAAEGLRRGLVLAIVQFQVTVLNAGDVGRWFLHRVRTRSWCAGFYIVLFIFALVVTLLLGVLKVVLLFLHNVLQGLVMSLYRRSAEAVSDLDPLQLFALELPTHVRPLRRLQPQDAAAGFAPGDVHPSAQTQPAPRQAHEARGSPRASPAPGVAPGLTPSSRGGAAAGLGGLGGGEAPPVSGVLAPFAFLPSLARAQLEPAEAVRLWRRRRDPHGEGREENVVSATCCKSSTCGEGEASILADTGRHLALLHVTGWGGVPPDGRPSRPKPSYRWAWRVRRCDVTAVSLSRSTSSGWVLKLELGVGEASSRAKFVHFASEAQAHRALETLAQGTYLHSDAVAAATEHSGAPN